MTYQILFEQPTPPGAQIHYQLIPNGQLFANGSSFAGLQFIDLESEAYVTLQPGTEVYEIEVTDDLFYAVSAYSSYPGALIAAAPAACDLEPVMELGRLEAGATELSVPVTIRADIADDVDGRFWLRVSPAGRPDLALANIPVDILAAHRDDDLPVVTPFREVTEVDEGIGVAVITFVVETEYSGALFASTQGNGTATTPSILGPGDYLPFDGQPAVLESPGLSGRLGRHSHSAGRGQHC